MNTRGKMLVNLATQGLVTKQKVPMRKTKKRKRTDLTSAKKQSQANNRNENSDDTLYETLLNNIDSLNEVLYQNLENGNKDDMDLTSSKDPLVTNNANNNSDGTVQDILLNSTDSYKAVPDRKIESSGIICQYLENNSEAMGLTSPKGLSPENNDNNDSFMQQIFSNNTDSLNKAVPGTMTENNEIICPYPENNSNDIMGLPSSKDSSLANNRNNNDDVSMQEILNNTNSLTEALSGITIGSNEIIYQYLGNNSENKTGLTSPKDFSLENNDNHNDTTMQDILRNKDSLNNAVPGGMIESNEVIICQNLENNEDKIVFNNGSSDTTLTYHSTSSSHRSQSSSSDFVPDSLDDSELSDDCFISRKRKRGALLLNKLIDSDTSVAEQHNEVTSSNMNTVEESTPQRNESESDLSSDDSIVQIRHSKKNKSGKRKRDKRHCCYICQTLICNLPRHLEKKHSSDVDVSKIMSLPIGSKQRRKEYARLQHIGDFYHNCEVLTLKKGELILIRVPTPHEKKKYTYVDYGPCPDCLGFMLKKNITVHVKRKTCIEHKGTGGRNCLSECNSLLNGIYSPALNENFITHIVNKLKTDEISQICKENNLILKFGNMMFEKYDVSQSEWIRQSMRQLARLVLQMKVNNASTANNVLLTDCLTPQNFDNIVGATKSLCSVVASSVSRPEFKTPSLGLKIGHHIRKCVAIARGEALRQGNIKRNKELISFTSIMDLEWNIKISSNALNSLYKRKFNSSQLLPVTEDLIKLNKYLQHEMNKSKDALKNNPSPMNYTQFASVILSRLVLFNKRRSGETAKMTIKQYMMRPLWSDQTTDELKKSLTKFETTLAENMVVVDIEGKRGRKVPVILTPDLKSGIDMLINSRNVCGISNKNPFIFARAHDSTSHLRGHDCIKKFVKCADLLHPENINGTKLRKYIATVCQIFNLTENETDWLARHLGHDIRVHREFYRLHESAVELTKISRLLLAVDKGEAKSFAGKSLDEIEINDLPNLEDDEVSDGEKNADKVCDAEKDEIDEVVDTSRNDPVVKSKSGKKQEQNQRSNCKNPWSSKESEAVLKFFRVNVSKEIVPRKSECVDCLEKHPVLSKRRWTDIKFYIKNHIEKIRKQKKRSVK